MALVDADTYLRLRAEGHGHDEAEAVSLVRTNPRAIVALAPSARALKWMLAVQLALTFVLLLMVW